MPDPSKSYSKYLGAECTIPSSWGVLKIRSASFTDAIDGDLIVTFGEGFEAERPLVRVHSECVFAESLGSLLCDCAEQLEIALARMRAEGDGILFYLRIDGRGAGLAAKVAATALEVDENLDTHESRVRIGVEPDDRNYESVGKYLSSEGVTRIRLMTNNPDKAADLKKYLTEVSVESLRVPQPSPLVEKLYSTKRAKFRHRT